MNGRQALLRFVIATCLVLLPAWQAVAAPAGDAPPKGRVAKPILETGKGDRCVEDTQFMRKNHMRLLTHQRDDTVRQGIRTRQHSLKGCIDCHASRNNNSVIGSNENFCQGCHAYAGIKLDCFDCHASRPGATPPPGLSHSQPMAASSDQAIHKP